MAVTRVESGGGWLAAAAMVAARACVAEVKDDDSAVTDAQQPKPIIFSVAA